MLPVISDPESLRSPTSTSPTNDDAASLLSDPRYRTILRRLETTTPTSVVDLADHLTHEEADDERTRIAELGDALFGTHRRLRLSLRHAHLPALADAGVVHFDPATNLVSLADPGADLLARVPSSDECEKLVTRTNGGESPTQ